MILGFLLEIFDISVLFNTFSWGETIFVDECFFAFKEVAVW